MKLTGNLGVLAALTWLPRRVTRPGVLRPGSGRTEISEPVLTGLFEGLSRDAEAVDEKHAEAR